MDDSFDAVPGELVDATEQFLESKARGSEGNYRRNCERALRGFFEYVETEDAKPPGDVTDLDESHFRRFARYLTVEDWLDDGGNSKNEDETSFNQPLSDGSKLTYYNMVAAWCGWCVREGVLPVHYANRDAAKEPLPENGEGSVRDQQTWEPEHRAMITSYVDHRVDRALETTERAADVAVELRDRAFVYVLAYSGVRGGEILRDPNDGSRNGLRWEDVDLGQELIWVVPKKRSANIDDRPLTPKPIAPLKRLYDALDPSPQWPVFPSLAWPTLYAGLREGAPANLSENEIESSLDAAQGRAELLELHREWDVVPSAMNTSAGRQTMKRLCKQLNGDERFDGELHLNDGKHDYLAPHGARRGVGKVLVKQRGYDRAAEQLDNTPRVVQQHYSHIRAPERSADVGHAFDEEDTD